MSLDLRLDGLRVHNGAFAVGPVELHIPAGAYGILLGPSGAGKSTILGALAGMHPATGRALLGPDDLLVLPPEKRGVGLVPQGGVLFPHLSVAGNVGFGVARSERRALVEEMLARVGASALARRDPRTLSGGETMRVALARALAIRPRLLLLDEPLVGLDPGARDALLELLGGLSGWLGGVPVLHVTHHFAEVEPIATHLAVLLAGGIAASGTPASVLAETDPAVAAFLYGGGAGQRAPGRDGPPGPTGELPAWPTAS